MSAQANAIYKCRVIVIFDVRKKQKRKREKKNIEHKLWMNLTSFTRAWTALIVRGRSDHVAAVRNPQLSNAFSSKYKMRMLKFDSQINYLCRWKQWKAYGLRSASGRWLIWAHDCNRLFGFGKQISAGDSFVQRNRKPTVCERMNETIPNSNMLKLKYVNGQQIDVDAKIRWIIFQRKNYSHKKFIRNEKRIKIWKTLSNWGIQWVIHVIDRAQRRNELPNKSLWNPR